MEKIIKRNTVQSQIILETVQKMHSHVTAEEVLMQIQKNHPNISRATVYRNLNILYEEGKIGRISVPDNAAKFDFMPAHHYHVRCEKCDKLFDVDMNGLDSVEEDLKRKIKNDNGFTFTGCDIIFKGICPECKKSAKI